ncbi:MAG: PAS domain S-box protein [Candidatus Hermodarchaeota archaeon]
MIVSELYQDEKAFKELFENINSGVAIYETNDNGETFIVREMNKAGLEMCEITREALIGKNLLEVFPNADEFGFIDTLRRVWNTGTSEHSPTTLYNDDRVPGWTEMYNYRLPSKKVVTIFETQTKLVEAEEKPKETEKELERLNKELEERIKNRSKALEEFEEKYHKLFENSPIALMEQDYSDVKKYVDYLKKSGISDFEKYLDEKPEEIFNLISKIKIVDVNQKVLELYNANNKENFILRMNDHENIDNRMTEEVLLDNKMELLSLIHNNKNYESEIVTNSFTGENISLYVKTSILPGFENTWEMVIVSLLDITERKLTEEKLKASEEKYRKLFENSPIAMMEQDYSEGKRYIDQLKSSGITDFEKYFDENPQEVVKLITLGKIIDVNRKTLDLYNANTKEEFISAANHLRDGLIKNLTDEVLSYNKEEYLTFMKGETIYESEIASKTFTEDIIYIYAKTAIMPGFENSWAKVVVTLIDITKNKIAEEKLKESEEKFKTLADQSLMGIFIIQDNKTIYANGKLADMMGYSFEQLMSMTLEDQLIRVHRDDREFVKEQAIKKQKGEKDVVNQYQFRYNKESEELMWIEVYSKTILYGGKPANFVTFVDITNQKQIEEALQKSETEKSAIIESLLEHIVYQTPDNTIIYANKSAADSVNLSPQELIGKKCYQIWNTRDKPCEDCPVLEAVKTKEPAISEMSTPDGRIWHVGSYPVKDKDDNVIAIVESTLDITEKKTAEEKVRKSEEKYRKAYYQANLYRDIFAHDINNILQNISSSVELSSLYLNNPEKLHTIKELYEIVDEQVNRAKKLILNVRKITELDESEIVLDKIEANNVLKNAIEFLESSFQTRNINIEINSHMKKNYVYADNLLLDVFENLLINAVRYNNRSNIDIVIDIEKEQKGGKNYLKMEFKDNGVGISDYRKKIIFERGTQKSRKSKGMGLGLSLVKKIIDNYQGEIWVEDRITGDYKQGSNFIILIPSDT